MDILKSASTTQEIIRNFSREGLQRKVQVRCFLLQVIQEDAAVGCNIVNAKSNIYYKSCER